MLGREAYSWAIVLEPSSLEVEIAIPKLERHKSPGTEQIPTELFPKWSETLRSVIHKPLNYV
jgi:hypothetical protein